MTTPMASAAPAKKTRAKKAAPEAVASPIAAPIETSVIAYKAFNPDWTCRDQQFEVGKTYEMTGKAMLCSNGFHACENPLDIFNYYPLGSPMARVRVGGDIARQADGDTKLCGLRITVEAEIKLPEMIRDAIAWVKAACAGSGEGASSGHYATNASSGDYATNASSGDYATNASSGDCAKNEATGEHSVISAAGRDSLAKGAKGVWISLAEYQWVDGAYICVGFATGQAGYGDVPADVWLKASGGKLVEAA